MTLSMKSPIDAFTELGCHPNQVIEVYEHWKGCLMYYEKRLAEARKIVRRQEDNIEHAEPLIKKMELYLKQNNVNPDDIEPNEI